MKIKEIIGLIDGELLSGNYDDEISEIKQDTRIISKGDTFIAFKGENEDGNTYIESAITNGASTCIINVKDYDLKGKKCNMIYVPDSLKALQKIIKYKMDNIDTKVVAVTGSVGKTSTRELIYEVVSTEYPVFRTSKNFNGMRGLPLTCSGIKDEDFAVLEMGMDGFGQLKELSEMVSPYIAVITNIGSSHIGKLGSKENILSAKAEIISGIRNNGFLILNADDPMLQSIISNWSKYQKDGKNINLLTYGIENKNAAFVANILEEDEKFTRFNLKILDQEFEFKINTTGKHNIYNSLVAICVSKILDISFENVAKGLLNMKSTEHRLDRFLTNKNMIVYDDTYNASYESIMAAIDVISSKKHYGRKVYIIGDVLELGEHAENYHRMIGQYIVTKGVDLLITAGENSKYINEEVLKYLPNVQAFHFKDRNEIIENLNLLQEDDILLIKASNGMKFIDIVKVLKQDEVSLEDIK